MHALHLRADPSCSAGYLYYTCDNGFAGCCGIDPCAPLPGCPDSALPPSTSSMTSKTATKPSTKTSTRTVKTRDTTDSTDTATATDSTSTDSSATTTDSSPTSTSSDATTSDSGSSSPANTAPAIAAHSPQGGGATNVGAIVGGVIGGILALCLLIAVALVLFRRRKHIKELSKATLSRRPDMQPMESDRRSGIFAPYGGFYRGVKDVNETSDTTRSAPSVDNDSQPLTLAGRSYSTSQEHNKDLDTHASVSPTDVSQLSHNSQALSQLTSPNPHVATELEDTSPPVSPLQQQDTRTSRRWTHLASLPSESPVLGTGAAAQSAPNTRSLGTADAAMAAGYRPYRPASTTPQPTPPPPTFTRPPSVHPPSLSPGPVDHNRRASENAMISISNAMRKESESSLYGVSPTSHGPASASPRGPQQPGMLNTTGLARNNTRPGVRRGRSGSEHVMSWAEFSPYEDKGEGLVRLPPVPVETPLGTDIAQERPSIAPVDGAMLAHTERKMSGGSDEQHLAKVEGSAEVSKKGEECGKKEWMETDIGLGARSHWSR